MLSFRALSEKKTKIKINPKQADITEMENNHGEDCDCMKCEKKRRKEGGEKEVATEAKVYDPMEDDTFDHDEAEATRGQSGKNKSITIKKKTKKTTKEETAYVSQEEVSEESNQESETETLLTFGQFIAEMPYQVYGSPDGKKEKKIGKPVKSGKYAAARAAELEDTHRATGGKYRAQKEEVEIEEGMTLKDFKANRRKNERKAATADARKRGHEGSEWHNSGRTYSPDEAKSRRANMSDDDRAARHRAAVDPDDDRDTNYYSADKTKNPKKQRKQAAMGEETINERTRYAKETGKDFTTGKPSEKGGTLGGDDRHAKVMRHVQQSMRKTGGMMSSRKKPIQPQGKKKVKGAKPSFKMEPTPVDKIKAKLAQKRKPKPDIGSRFD